MWNKLATHDAETYSVQIEYIYEEAIHYDLGNIVPVGKHWIYDCKFLYGIANIFWWYFSF